MPDSGNDGVTVTIGIPFLNARRTLADAVRSVFAQTHGDWELLLVDDGSTDGSSDVVRQLLDPRVRLLADGVTLGLCARLNQIAAAARGAYLARMDADDLMHPERIARQLEHLRPTRASTWSTPPPSRWTTTSPRWVSGASGRSMPARRRCCATAS